MKDVLVLFPADTIIRDHYPAQNLSLGFGE